MGKYCGGNVIKVIFGNGKYVTTVTIYGNGSALVTVPVMIDDEEVNYTWEEHVVNGYRITSVTTENDITVIVNSIYRVPKVPVNWVQPKVPQKPMMRNFDEYETALGGQTTINHVGDCFD